MDQQSLPEKRLSNVNTDDEDEGTDYNGVAVVTCKGNSSTGGLSMKEFFSLACLVLAYACTMSSTTLIVGTLPLVVLSVGGSRQIAPFALGTIFLGSAGISLVTTHIFTRWGRKVGFVVGALLGIVGTVICAVAVIMKSPGLAILGGIPIGAGNGVGMYMRFAAVEVVSLESYHAVAVTLVLSGGVLAAFAGPESAQAATNKNSHFLGANGERDYPYLGVMVVAAIFYIANAVFVSLVSYPRLTPPSQADIDAREANNTLRSLLSRQTFWVPAAVSSLCWAIMAMPMSLVRVAMKDVGFTQRKSLTTIELHFLGMFAPGLLITSLLLTNLGPRRTAYAGVAAFGVAEVFGLVSKEQYNGTAATWMLALILLGVGWNFGFSGATVILTKEAYTSAPYLKPSVQAANDFIMFLFGGIGIFATGYIYKAGGNGLPGWQTVIYVVIALTVFLGAILAIDFYFHSLPKFQEPETEKNFAEEQPFQSQRLEMPMEP